MEGEILQAKVRVALRIKRAEAKVRQKALELNMANWDLESFAYSASDDLRALLRYIHTYCIVTLFKKTIVRT